MANISITQRCNRRCSYCFAAETMRATPGASAFMPMEEFEEALDFHARSCGDPVSLLGGEPTIHPLFLEMLDRVLARGLKATVLSGGLMPEAVIERLAALSPDQVAVLLNVAPPGEEGFTDHERSRQEATMRRLGPRVIPGLNIASPATPLDFLLEWIERYGLARVARMGVAHPIVGGDNEFLHPRDYRAVGWRVADFAFRARDAGVVLEFDCGWVPCMFPDGVLEELGLGPQQVGLRCNPILDVLPGRQVISCYPLAALAREPVPETENDRWLVDRFTERLAPYRAAMLFKECATCPWMLRGECAGGCVANSLRRARRPVIHRPVPEGAAA